MKLRALAIAAPLIVLAFLMPQPSLALGCTAEINIKGKMPTDRRHFTIPEFNVTQTGFLGTAAFEPMPPTFSVNIGGPQEISLRYSKSVTSIRVHTGGKTLYEGPPIAAVNATEITKGTLNVEFKWAGEGAVLAVSRQCTL